MVSSVNIENKWFLKVENGLKELEKTTIKVGYFDAVNAEKAALNTFGGETVYSDGKLKGQKVTVPPRPFIKKALEDNLEKIFQQACLKYFGEQGYVKKIGYEIGNECVEAIKEVIDNSQSELPYPDNSPRTIRNKGFNHPLINTGEMRDATEYKVYIK